MGVELASDRHARGVEAIADLLQGCSAGDLLDAHSDAVLVVQDQETASFCNGQLRLIQGDILECDLSDATVVWCANVCFAPEFDRQIAQKLALQPRLRAIALIKDFPEGVAGFEYGGAADFDMSWSQECRDQGIGSGGRVHFYSRRA